VTSGAVRFEWLPDEPTALGDVPPVVFSETMRDADLLVSLAAFGEGGFTSEETRRLRASLVRHVARALGLTTVYVSGDERTSSSMAPAPLPPPPGQGSGCWRRAAGTSTPARRHPGRSVLVESADSLTARIGHRRRLSHDDRIIEPTFISQPDATE
jgi:hypothetical protein